ncbi:MAG: hypothetical protein LBD13_07155, partial [Spirochaetaceae bacterium]|nr:hypothetical protein [Spirochaetaceae bacterium]
MNKTRYFLFFIFLLFYYTKNHPPRQQPEAVSHPAGDSGASCGERVCNFSHNPEATPQRASIAHGREAGSLEWGFGGT